MILRVVLLSLLAGPTIIEAFNVPAVCPCTFLVNRAVKGIKHLFRKDKDGGYTLPPQEKNETYESYIQRVFLQQEDEKVEEYYERIFAQYKNEKDDKYVERIDTIYSVFPTLPCKDNTEFWKYSEKYYTLKYDRVHRILPFLKESDDQYYARILRREKNEEFDAYIKRLDCIFKAYPKLEIWRQIKFDSDCRNWYFYRHLTYNCAIRPSENIRESIVKTYERRDGEKGDDFSYYKRITERLTGESDEDYVERLTRIRARFSSLPLWYSAEYIDLTKNYYKLLYAKKENEDLKDYFKRLTAKAATEDFNTYVKRIDILQRVYDDLPLWNSCDYLQYTAPYYNWVLAKKADEDDKSYLKRITARQPSESLETYLKRLNVCRWVNRGNDLFYDKANWAYIKNYYENYYKKGQEDVDVWLKKVFKRDFDESEEAYVKRLNLVTSVRESLAKVDIQEKSLKCVSDYYRLVYKIKPNEDKDAWLKRVTKKLPIETDVTYQTRLKYLENVYTDCRSYVGGVLKQLVGSGKSCSSPDEKKAEVFLVKRKEKESKKEVTKEKKQSSEKKSLKKSIEEEIEEIYGKKSNEDEQSWFKRITEKSSDDSTEEYIETLNLVRKYYPSLPLWYEKKNLVFVKNYYTSLYKKLEKETDEQYFKRIVTKESWESLDQTAQRVALVREINPTLPLWTEEKYYDLVKKVYEVEYKIRAGESTQEYVQRILAKNEAVDSSTELWAKRVRLIQRATASSNIWYDQKYYSFTKSYFAVWYKKQETESCDAWLTRVLKPLPGEDEDNSIKRVRLVKQTVGDCGCWTEFTFKKVAGSHCLSEEYLEDIENEFFDSATTYERIYSSSKSSSSSSSSSSEESYQVVQTA